MSWLTAGTLVLADWRGRALPREPTGIRPGVVIDGEAFPEDYANTLVVPFTRDLSLVDATFALRIEPTAENGASATSWALPHHLTSVSRRRVRPTNSRITSDQLWEIRQRIALAIGLV
ncbi:MAG TPA: type II toxin-antitoxin system PemK/MazF family toxin [Chloroflexota bacterium]